MVEAELKELKFQLKDFLHKGFIKPITCLCGDFLLFLKIENGSLKMCIDYMKLKKVAIMFKYPIHRIDDLFDKLQGASYFSKIYLRLVYHKHKVRGKNIP